ncbi:MAG: hypothetical protein RL398_1925 [Planctomycetota bacterium]|jgi:hypothetical protein
MLRIALTVFSVVVAVVAAPAQGDGAPTSPATTASVPQAPASTQRPPALDATTIQALERIAAALVQRRERLANALSRQDLDTAATAELEIRELEWQFANLATRLDVKEFEQPSDGTFDLQNEVVDLMRPLLQAVKGATEGPRQVAELDRAIQQKLERQRAAEAALRQTELTRDALPPGSPARAEAERELRERWTPAVQDLQREVVVLQARLQARGENQPSLFESVWSGAGRFLRSSGLNLLLTAVTFFCTFALLRWLRRRLLLSFTRGTTFAHRLADLLVQTLIVLVAIAAMMVVPYARNDWLLLAIGIVFMVGIGWLAVRTAPQLFEQFRLLLNVGAVREGERMMLDGLPYQVTALRLYAWLDNPDLQGGRVRLPVRSLVGRHSRPSGEHEPWFPSRAGDFVQLADGVFGTVLVQTPQSVVVADLDAQRTYPTLDYLALRPRNLSQGFSLLGEFALEYALADRADAVAQTLADGLRARLREAVPADALLDVAVRLRAVGKHALEFEVQTRFAGTAAREFLAVRGAVQAALLATAASEGWRIPLPQLTVHGTASR